MIYKIFSITKLTFFYRYCVTTIFQIGDTDKHWVSTPVTTRTAECNGANSAISTPSTISPTPDTAPLEEDLSKGAEMDRTDFRTINNRYKNFFRPPSNYYFAFSSILGFLWQ